MRVLSALAICLSYSGDPSEIGSFVILPTLFQALFSLQGSLLAEGDPEGASYVQNLINGITRVGCEGVDASLLMQQYGVQLRSEADVQAVLDCVIMMALAACIENTTYGEHWHMLNSVMVAKVSIRCILRPHDMTSSQESWFDASGSSHYSPNLIRIETLSISQCSHALSTFLLSTDGARPSAEDCHLAFTILTEWSIPAADSLALEGSFDCKVMSSKLALSILSISRKEFGEAICSLFENWHGDDGQWKAAFNAAIQIVVGIVIFTLLKLHYVSTG